MTYVMYLTFLMYIRYLMYLVHHRAAMCLLILNHQCTMKSNSPNFVFAVNLFLLTYDIITGASENHFWPLITLLYSIRRHE